MARLVFLGFLTCFFTAATLMADKVVLKNGDVVEGRVLRVTSTEVVMEVNFSPTIIEERRIPREEVESIEREAEDEKAFQELQNIRIPDTALDPEDFQRIITRRLQPFLEKYGYSSRARDVRQMVSELEAEIARFEEGQIKLDGVWIDRSDIGTDDYQLSAREALARMRRESQGGDVVTALNQFTVIEEKWPGASAFPDAVELAIRDLNRLDRLMGHELRNLEIRDADREERMQLVSDEDRRRIQAARDAELERSRAAIERSRERGEKFPPYFINDPKSLEGLQKIARTEVDRLSDLNLSQMRRAIEEARLAARQLSEREFPTAAVALERAESLWPEYEPLPRLREELEEGKRRAEEAAEAHAKAMRDAADLAEKEDAASQDD